MITPPQGPPSSDQDTDSRRFGRIALVAGAVVVVSAMTAGVALAVTHRSAPSPRSTTGATAPVPPARSLSQPKVKPLVALVVDSISPSASATKVNTDRRIAITFSVPPAAASPAPTLTPPVTGSWVLRGARWIFRPLGGYTPTIKETVTVPASTTALEGRRRVRLEVPYTSSFTVGSGSLLRLQQLLAELHYLPFTFTRAPATRTAPAPTASPALSALATEPTAADAVPVGPQPGVLSWAYPAIPASLSAVWSEGKAGQITQGAVMAFEADRGLAVDGVAGPKVWAALVASVAARQLDPRPYNYIEVTESSPETLTVWQNGNTDVYSSPVNTGAPGAATEQGTFPVYLRYASHAMIGTNPDGSKYDDPDIQWIAYFNGGDAVHGYPRAEYGFPQSNGCVELPIPNAGEVFTSGEDWYGTLVNVT